MKWTYPAFLFALAVIIIPLLIHLFHFKRYKTVYFSSLNFLKTVELEQKSIRKLKKWLIFALRALAFIFLVFAFAQPYKPLKSTTEKAGVNVIAVYLDNSFSMTQIGKTGELISQARQIAKDLAKKAPRDAQFVLFTNELSGKEKQSLTKVQFLERIEEINASPLVRSGNEITRWWQQWLNDAQRNLVQIANSQLIFLSDFQNSTLKKINKTNNWSTLFYPIQLSAVKPGNLTVDSIWFESPVQKVGNMQTIYAYIHNDGEENFKNVEVSIKIGEIHRDVFANLAPNSSDTVSLSFFNAKGGNIQGSVTINDKQMTADDSYFFTLDVREKGKIVIINGEDAVNNCALVFGLDNFYEVKTVEQNGISQGILQDVDLVVLNGINNLQAGTSNQLKLFAEKKGGILIFPGKNIAAGSYSNLFNPLKLPSFGPLTEAGLIVKKENTVDTFFDGIFDQKPENVNLPLVQKAYRLSEGQENLSIDLLSFQNGGSFFIRGTAYPNCFVCASSLVSDFGSFSANQLFSTFLLRIGELSLRSQPYFLTIGESKSFPVKKNSTAEAPISLVKGPIKVIPTVLTKGESAYISVQGSEIVRQLQAGNYTVFQNKDELGKLSINYSRAESRISALSKNEVINNFENAGIKVQQFNASEGWMGSGFLELAKPVQYWKWCLFFVLLFLVAEQLVVIFFKQK